MANKPYLITIASNHGNVKRYLDTLANVSKQVESILVSYNPQIPIEQCGNVDKVIRIDEPYPGNLYRFKDFPRDLDPERMVIFTDMSDVWFQTELPDFENDIYVCPEYDFWGKENWWKKHLDAFNFHYLDGEPIYNMGTWAMPVKKAYELMKFLEDRSILFGHWQASDQPLFNLWLQYQEFVVHENLMCCLYTGKSVRTDGKYFWDKTTEKWISIIHANGNSKEIYG